MKRLLLFLAVFTGLTSALPAQAQDESKEEKSDSQRRFEGSIGGSLGIVLLLDERPGDEGYPLYDGAYYYRKTGVPIALGQHSEPDEETVVFRENELFDGEGESTFTGQWTVKIEGDSITGTWSSKDGKKKLPIELKESYPQGSVPVVTTAVESVQTFRLDDVENGAETRVRYVQLDADSAPVQEINRVLRQDAWNVQGLTEEDEEEVPENPSEKDILKAVLASTEPLEDEEGEDEMEDPFVHSITDEQKVLMNEGGHFTVEYLTAVYEGGAHGNSSKVFRSFDLNTGKELVLEDLVKPGYEKRWAELGAAELRAKAGLKPDAPLTDAGLFEDKLELNATWYLTPGGIGFSYDPYEISPYALGYVEFVLPWKDIFIDLKPGTGVYRLAEPLVPKDKEKR